MPNFDIVSLNFLICTIILIYCIIILCSKFSLTKHQCDSEGFNSEWGKHNWNNMMKYSKIGYVLQHDLCRNSNLFSPKNLLYNFWKLFMPYFLFPKSQFQNCYLQICLIIAANEKSFKVVFRLKYRKAFSLQNKKNYKS